MRSRRARRWASVLVVILGTVALGACADDEPTAEPADATSVAPTTEAVGATTTPHESTTAPDPASATSQPATTSPDTTQPSTGPGVVVVGADGVAGLTMGADADQVIDAVSGVLGPPDDDGPAECPGGSDRTVRWAGSFQVQLAQGALAGWVWSSPGPPPDVPVVTDGGIALGDPVADLLAAYPDDFQWVPDSTLGVEFFIGTGYPYLGGLATGEQPTDAVTALFAGDSCAYR